MVNATRTRETIWAGDPATGLAVKTRVASNQVPGAPFGARTFMNFVLVTSTGAELDAAPALSCENAHSHPTIGTSRESKRRTEIMVG
jgi:hypothetical protein